MSRLELGDTPGHPFRGNQYTPGHPFGGREYHLEAHTTYAEARRAGASHEDALDAVYSTHGREVGAMFERTKNLEPPVGRKTAGDAKIGDRVKIVGAELGNEHLIGRTADVRDVRVASRGDDVAKLGNVKDWGMELKGYPLKWLEVQPAATTAAVIERLDRLEAAVLSLARVELGDSEGHPFRGNQHTSGSGGGTGKSSGGDTVDHTVIKTLDNGPQPHVKNPQDWAVGVREGGKLSRGRFNDDTAGLQDYARKMLDAADAGKKVDAPPGVDLVSFFEGVLSYADQTLR